MSDDSNHDNFSALISVTVSLTTISTVAVCLRVLSRKLASVKLWWDEAFIFLSLFLIYGNLALNILEIHYGTGLEQIVNLRKVIYSEEALYAVVVTTVKTSVLLFYLRIFGVRPDVRKTIYATEALVVAWGIATFFVSIFHCLPISNFFEDSTGTHCVRFLLATAIPNTLLDIALLVLPLNVLRTLQLSTRKKIALSVVFSLGLFVCAASVVRIWSVAAFDQAGVSWDYANPTIWSIVEVNVGITCACLPTLQPLLNAALNKGMAGSWKKSSNGSSSHSWPRGGRQLLPGGDFQRMENNFTPLTLPSFSSDGWTSVLNTAAIQSEEPEPALAGTTQVKKDVGVEQGQSYA